MARHHYLGYRGIVGEAMRYAALLDGRWVALLGWGACAFKSRHRDAWIGWPPALQWQRLKWVANNTRFLLLPRVRIPNLASKILSLNLKRLSQDWRAAWGHGILLAETFVDTVRFTGTCYRAAGWLPLGASRGFGRNAGKYHAHGRPKTIFVRPLHPQARRLLSDPASPPEPGTKETPMKVHAHCLKDTDRLLDCLRTVPEPRHARGIRHSKLSILAVAACAVLCGAKSFAAIGEWAARCSQPMLRRLLCRRQRETGRYLPPSEPTLRRLLQRIDAHAVDRAIGVWLAAQSRAGGADAVAIDGKTLRGARRPDGKQVQLLAAFLHRQGVVMAQQEVDPRHNEISALRPLLQDVDLSGLVVTGDAMHTQKDAAHFLVKEKGADYFFTLKDNQAALKKDVEDLGLEAFPPSA